uniref:NADH-ubiquinone oxidoreductase chain 5 n=1 Tax=Gondogeneia antarctica TaxID=1109128 RepID=G8IQQ0_GONAN|nr:NADH dehydrogenase subunit 5 [Gondogeneia antarctica]
MKSSVYNIFSCIFILMSFFLFICSMSLGYSDKSYFIEWCVIGVLSYDFVYVMLFDWISVSFLSVVCLISGSVVNYCKYYMDSEKNGLRFLATLMLFIISMFLLIISPNMISLLVGWDGLGVTSYALVIYYQNEKSSNAGMLTVLSNRIGDMCILMSIGLMSCKGGWNFLFLEEISPLIVVLVVVACMTKSAQMPFSAWLPAAMAAPTPVSSLVHSSTLVTAGVYLLIRFNEHVEMSGSSIYLTYIGLFTMVASGVSAMIEKDLKKVIALSTLSQLGLMFMVLGINMPLLAFFHLVTHALFKSSLFMCAGFMIHSMSGVQEGNRASGFSVSSPVLSLGLGISNLALCGFPFLAGFYSKEIILENMISDSNNFYVSVGLVFGTGLTICYSMRFIYNSMSSINRLVNPVNGLGDMDLVTMKSVSGLLVLSVLGGYLFGMINYMQMSGVVLNMFEKYSFLLVSLFSGLAVYMRSSMEYNENSVFTLKVRKYFTGNLRGVVVSSKIMNESVFLAGGSSDLTMSMGWFEYYGGQGVGFYFMKFSSLLQMSQKSFLIKSYLLVFSMFILFMYL